MTINRQWPFRTDSRVPPKHKQIILIFWFSIEREEEKMENCVNEPKRCVFDAHNKQQFVDKSSKARAAIHISHFN